MGNQMCEEEPFTSGGNPLRDDAFCLRLALDEEPVVQVDEVHDREDQQRRFPAYAPAGHAYQPGNTGADQIVRK